MREAKYLAALFGELDFGHSPVRPFGQVALGYTADQVVHDYGDLCQAITDLAFERDAPFAVDEFRTLNRCLDNAIADAVLTTGGAFADSPYP